MRIQVSEYFNQVAFDAAIAAGHGPQLLRQLESKGIIFDKRLGTMVFPKPGLDLSDDATVFDAQPELVTQSNTGIPAFLSNMVDPKLIKVLVSPMKAAEIAGEMKKGDWTTTVVTFPVVESTGEVSSYGDFNSNGSVEVNANFPQRQSYHYQTFTQWGERELANASLAKIDWASQLNISSVLVLNKYQNLTYFFGVAGLQNYGLLNDPALPAPIAPTVQWNLASTSADQVYEDIRRMFLQLQTQSNGTVEATMAITLAMSPTLAVSLLKTNNFGIQVGDLLKKNFPGLTVKTAVEYDTDAGQLVQMILDEYEGQETLTAAFTEKLRAHAMVIDTSSFKQKKSQGTWGTIIFRPFFVASLIGA